MGGIAEVTLFSTGEKSLATSGVQLATAFQCEHEICPFPSTKYVGFWGRWAGTDY